MSAQSAIYNPTNTTSAASGDGFSTPRLTTTGRLAISFGTTDKGMMVYDTTLNNLFIWNGSAWESVPASGDAGANGSVQYNDNGVVSGAVNFVWDKTTTSAGIGTATPNDKLEVVGSGGAGIRVSRSGVATQYTTLSAGATGPSLDASAAIGALTFGVAGSTKMTLDSSGNVGIGITPSAWATSTTVWRALDLQYSCGLASSGAGSGEIDLLWNAYYDQTDQRWEFKYTGDRASRYEIRGSGVHNWYNTASAGTANAAIAWQQLMTLDASGNLAPIGNFVPANGKGIDFSATPETPGATSELFSDYEEGTWTGTLTFSTTPQTSVNAFTGRYTKVGRVVTIQGNLLIGPGGFVKGPAAGTLTLTGVPFAPLVGFSQYQDFAASLADMSAGSFCFCGINAGGTFFAFESIGVVGAVVERNFAAITAANFAAVNAGFMSLAVNITYTV